MNIFKKVLVLTLMAEPRLNLGLSEPRPLALRLPKGENYSRQHEVPLRPLVTKKVVFVGKGKTKKLLKPEGRV